MAFADLSSAFASAFADLSSAFSLAFDAFSSAFASAFIASSFVFNSEANAALAAFSSGASAFAFAFGGASLGSLLLLLFWLDTNSLGFGGISLGLGILPFGCCVFLLSAGIGFWFSLAVLYFPLLCLLLLFAV